MVGTFGDREDRGSDELVPVSLFTVSPVRFGVLIGLRSMSAVVAFILLRVFAEEDFISWSLGSNLLGLLAPRLRGCLFLCLLRSGTESAYKPKLLAQNLQRRGVAGEVSLSLLVTHDAQRPMALSVPGGVRVLDD